MNFKCLQHISNIKDTSTWKLIYSQLKVLVPCWWRTFWQPSFCRLALYFWCNIWDSLICETIQNCIKISRLNPVIDPNLHTSSTCIFQGFLPKIKVVKFDWWFVAEIFGLQKNPDIYPPYSYIIYSHSTNLDFQNKQTAEFYCHS